MNRPIYEMSSNKPSRKSPAKTCIQIDEQYAIADTHSWHVVERRRYKGGYRWESVACYGNINQCVRALVDMAVRTSGARTLGEPSRSATHYLGDLLSVAPIF
jgi:hypothetical protein